MNISITVCEETLWGGNMWAWDKKKSLAKYEKVLRGILEAVFPESTVTVTVATERGVCLFDGETSPVRASVAYSFADTLFLQTPAWLVHI